MRFCASQGDEADFSGVAPEDCSRHLEFYNSVPLTGVVVRFSCALLRKKIVVSGTGSLVNCTLQPWQHVQGARFASRTAGREALLKCNQAACLISTWKLSRFCGFCEALQMCSRCFLFVSRSYSWGRNRSEEVLCVWCGAQSVQATQRNLQAQRYEHQKHWMQG